MPASYELFPKDRLIVVTYSGVLSLEDVVAVRQQGIEDPEFDTNYDVIDDVSRVDSTDIRFEELGQLSGKSVAKAGVKRAFVVTTDFQRGMANMYRVLSESHGQEFNIFEDISVAKNWIALND